MAGNKDKEPFDNQKDSLQVELDRKTDELLTLREISELTSSTLDLDEMLHQIVSNITKKMRVDICSIYLIDKENMLILRATDGLNKDAVGKIKMKVGQGITGYSAKKGEPVSIPRADAHPKYMHFNEADEKGSYSMLSVPL